MTADVDVAVVGSPFLDLTFDGLPRVPLPGEELVGRALHVAPGGTGMQAIGLARLGLSVTLVAPLGSGLGADALRAAFEAEGVRLTGDDRTGATATTALLTTPEGVAMATVLGEGEPTAEEVRATGASSVVVSLGRLHLAPAEAAVYAVTGGLEVPHVGDSALEGLRSARAVVANAREAMELTGAADPMEAARALAGRGPTAVVTTGPDGAVAVDGDREARAGAPAVEAVDLTGAGDLFVAAYVWADRRGAGLEDRLRWATLYAALSVREATAFAGAVRLRELLDEGTRRGLTPP
ncbi:MAG: carbohydrate kinase family protein [Actinomycetota bacterium]